MTNPSNMKREDVKEHLSIDEKISLVEWKDNNKVLLASTCFGAYPQEHIKRWSSKEKKIIYIPCPIIVRQYNKIMGGVDLFNQQMEYYRTWFKTRRNERRR